MQAMTVIIRTPMAANTIMGNSFIEALDYLIMCNPVLAFSFHDNPHVGDAHARVLR
jgi:hypothetical protein